MPKQDCTIQQSNPSAADLDSYAAHIPLNWTSWTDLPLTVQRALDELVSRSFGKHPILDGDVHTDSVDQDPSKGSMIYATKALKWDELVVGAAGTVLWVSTDTPAWHALVEADIGDLGAYLLNIVEDLSPQLGGDLAGAAKNITNVAAIGVNGVATVGWLRILQDTIIDSNDNDVLLFTAAGGVVVNEITIGNSATTDPVTIDATGDDAAIDLEIDAKGAGILKLGANAGGTYIGDGAANYTAYAADGLMTMAGTARVVDGAWVPFNALKAPGTKPATFKEWGIGGVWEFSDATDDTVVFNIGVPPNMDRTVAPTLKVGWSTATVDTGETCTWQLEYLWTSPGEDTTAAAQETLTVDSNAIAQAHGMIVAEIAGIDIPSATDVCIHCRLKRLGAGGNDDLTDTAELHGVCLSYTSDKLGTAT